MSNYLPNQNTAIGSRIYNAGITADETDVAWALRSLADRRTEYQLYHDYLRGNHRLAFASSEYRAAFAALLTGLHVNICPAVVGALTDRLKVEGFTALDGGEQAGQDAWALWEGARLGGTHNRVHKEAIASGDAYLLVWPDASGRARFYPHTGLTMTHEHDAEEPDVITKAAKLWKDGKRYRLNLYYPDRIEKYRTMADTSGATVAAFGRYDDGDGDDIRNDFGRVPVFHFPFDSDTHAHGTAELRDIVPIQDSLNKAMHDLMVACEVVAFPQRLIIGVEEPVNDDGSPAALFQAGITRIMTVANPEAKAVTFPAADIEKYQSVKTGLYQDIAAIKGIPIHYFHLGGDFPSGESLKVAESRLVSRVDDTQVDFGDVWADALAFALRVENGTETQLRTVWADAASRNERSEAETVAIMVRDVGISQKEGWRRLRFSGDEIATMEAEKEMETTTTAAAFGQAFDAG